MLGIAIDLAMLVVLVSSVVGATFFGFLVLDQIAIILRLVLFGPF